jgi:hypothetical protein
MYSKELVVKELGAGDNGPLQNNEEENSDAKIVATKDCFSNATVPTTNINDQSDQDYIHIKGDAKFDKSSPFEINCPWYFGLDRSGRIYARLIDLYAFASTYNAPQLKLAVILVWQRFGMSCNSLPPVRVVERAFLKINGDEPLCKYIILWYGYFGGKIAFDVTKFSSVSPIFLAGVLDIMYQKQAGGFQFDGLDKNWCNFHEHVYEKEETICQESRLKDPDVVAKQAEELWDGVSQTRKFW